MLHAAAIPASLIFYTLTLISLATLHASLKRFPAPARCARCRQSLVGLDTPARCPECGQHLTLKRTIRTYTYRVSTPALLISLLALLCILAVSLQRLASA